jgi:hypothetical protein
MKIISITEADETADYWHHIYPVQWAGPSGSVRRNRMYVMKEWSLKLEDLHPLLGVEFTYRGDWYWCGDRRILNADGDYTLTGEGYAWVRSKLAEVVQ